MNDDEIRQGIMNKLNGISFELLHFERNHKAFSNMIARIKSGKKEYIFVFDRGDIVCNDKTIFTDASYHVVGGEYPDIGILPIFMLFYREEDLTLVVGGLTQEMAPFLPFSESDHLHQMIAKYMQLAHLPTLRKKTGMHSLRHTLASLLLENDTPLPAISDILGHVDTESTAVYLKVDIKRLKECPLDLVEDMA